MNIVTQFINFQLEPSVSLEDISVNGQIWRQVLNHLLSQQGCLAVHWSRHVESSDWVVITVDWESEKFDGESQKQSQLQELIEKLARNSIMVADTGTYGPRSVSNVIAAAPYTEILTQMVPSDTSDQELLAMAAECAKVSHSSESQPHGVQGVTSAWLHTDVDHDMSPTGKARVLKYLLAWPSMEAHRAVMATEQFKLAMGHIKAKCLPPLLGRTMFHAEFISVTAAGGKNTHL